MRSFAIVLLLALSTGAAASDETIEAATLDAVTALATKGYRAPEAAIVRGVRKSLARSGLGYCGEVSSGAGEEFTLFHAILADTDGKGASVLRLADYPKGDQNAGAVRQILEHFGCLDVGQPPTQEPDTR
jgi:hypothetical protein